MSGWLALVCEGLAVILVGVAPKRAALRVHLRASGAALLLLALLFASRASSALLGEPLHLLTLGVAAAFLALVPASEAEGREDAGRWDSVLVASLLVASSSHGWHVFLSASATLGALWIRLAGLTVPLFWFGSLLAAAGLSYSSLGSLAFSGAPLDGAASAALLTGSLALTASAAVLVSSQAFRCAADTALAGAVRERRLVLLTWTAVLIGAGPLQSAFSAVAWRDANGGWQALLALSGAIGIGIASLSAARGLREGGGPARLVGPLLSLQMALAWTAWGGVGAGARTAVLLGAFASLVGSLLFQASGSALWVRRVAFLVLSGVPASPSFWAHTFGLASLARAHSYGLCAVVALGSLCSWVLAARSLALPGAAFGTEKSAAWSPRMVALGLVLLSLFPGWLTARVVGDF